MRFTYNSTPQSLGVPSSNLTKYGWPASLNNQETWPQIQYPPYKDSPTSDKRLQFKLRTMCSRWRLALSIQRAPHDQSWYGIADFSIQLRKDNQAGGVFNFDNIFTSANPTAPGSTGYGFASFLLGYGATGQLTGVTGSPNEAKTDALTASEFKYQGYYVGDTFQVAKKLTLTMAFDGVYLGVHRAIQSRNDLGTECCQPPRSTDGFAGHGGIRIGGHAQSPGGEELPRSIGSYLRPVSV